MVSFLVTELYNQMLIQQLVIGLGGSAELILEIMLITF